MKIKLFFLLLFVISQSFAIDKYKKGDILYVLPKDGISLYEKPDLNSKVKKTLAYKDQVSVVEDKLKKVAYSIEEIALIPSTNPDEEGFEGFFGLDNANTQIKFLYGLKDWLTISGARSELAYDFSLKYNLQNQIKDGFPVAIVGFSSLAINNTLKESNYPKLKFDNRLIYVTQLSFSTKFS